MRPTAARPPVRACRETPTRLQPPAGSPASRRVPYGFLRLVGSAALVLLAFAVRVGGLADHSLWLDEAQLLVRAQSDLPTALLGRTPLDLAPPLYPLLLHLWTRLGEADFLVRFPSVVASVLAVAVLSRLRPWPVGPVAALLYAVVPTQILYAQEATPYALVGLLASAALVGFQALEVSETFRVSRPNQAGVWLVVLAVLSAYTYYGLAFLWLGLDLWLLIRYSRSFVPRGGFALPIRGFVSLPSAFRLLPSAPTTRHPRPTIRHVLLAHLAVVLACLPLLPLWQRQAQAGLDAWWGQYGSLEGWSALVLFGQGALTHSLVFALLPFSRPPSWLVLALLVLTGLGARRVGWAVGGVALPLALAYVAASLGRYPFEGRYLLFSAPALYALLAAGLTQLSGRIPPSLPGQGARGLVHNQARCSEGMLEANPLVRGRAVGLDKQSPDGLNTAPTGLGLPGAAALPPEGGSAPRTMPNRFPDYALGLAVALALAAVLVTAWPGLGLPVPWAAHPPREEVRPLLALLEQRRAPDDAVYVSYGAAPVIAHYSRLGLAPADLSLADGWPAGRTRFQAGQALAAARGHPRLWLLVAHALPGEEEALAETLTRRGAWLRERVTVPGAALLLWDMGE